MLRIYLSWGPKTSHGWHWFRTCSLMGRWLTQAIKCMKLKEDARGFENKIRRI